MGFGRSSIPAVELGAHGDERKSNDAFPIVKITWWYGSVSSGEGFGGFLSDLSLSLSRSLYASALITFVIS
mgnify:CR=1 FL=1